MIKTADDEKSSAVLLLLTPDEQNTQCPWATVTGDSAASCGFVYVLKVTVLFYAASGRVNAFRREA